MPTHSVHNIRLTIMQGYETPCYTLGKPTTAGESGDRTDLFLTVATSEDARAFPHSRRHTAGSGDVVVLEAAFSPTALAEHPSISIRQSVGVAWGYVVATAPPTLSPIRAEYPDVQLRLCGSARSNDESVPRNAQGFRPCVLQLEKPSLQTLSVVLRCRLAQ